MRTIIYMVRHDATGALGLVVNRPLGTTPLARLLDSLGRSGEGVSGTLRLHYGGPVEPKRGFVLHTAEWTGADSHVVQGGVAFTTDPAILEAVARGAGPRRFLVALGYAGWSPGQLEGEIEGGAWISVAADEALIFDEDAETKWDRAMARRKIVL
jgi:putative transcriptional regulator